MSSSKCHWTTKSFFSQKTIPYFIFWPSNDRMVVVFLCLWDLQNCMSRPPRKPPFTEARVDMVGRNHDKVLIQWRHMPMGRFRANIFLIRITSNYFWASKVFKNQSFKSQIFSPSPQKNIPNWNHGLILMLSLFFINNIQNLYQFSEKNLKNGQSCCLISKSIFALKCN